MKRPVVVRPPRIDAQAWSETPVREAAAELEMPLPDPTPSLPLPDVKKPTRGPKKAPRERVTKKPAPEEPWKRFMSDGGKRLANFNLPTELDAKLTWAAHRTFGTRTDVLVKALTEYIDRLVEDES